VRHHKIDMAPPSKAARDRRENVGFSAGAAARLRPCSRNRPGKADGTLPAFKQIHAGMATFMAHKVVLACQSGLTRTSYFCACWRNRVCGVAVKVKKLRNCRYTPAICVMPLIWNRDALAVRQDLMSPYGSRPGALPWCAG
jgi:hypothetical protein